MNWVLSLFRPRRAARLEPLDPHEERVLDELRRRRAAAAKATPCEERAS